MNVIGIIDMIQSSFVTGIICILGYLIYKDQKSKKKKIKKK